MKVANCIVCSKTFTRGQSYQRHLESEYHLKRTQTDNNKYTCKCGKIFSYRQSFHAHKKVCTVENVKYNTDKSNSTETNIQIQTQITDLENKFEEFCAKSVSPPSTIQPIQSIHPPKTKRQNVSYKMRLQIKESQNHQCGACQKDLTDIFEIDHVVALQFGGTNLVDNLMALCCECHSKKSIKENKCRKKIQAAIKSILEES
jgi:hypothetical protein